MSRVSSGLEYNLLGKLLRNLLHVVLTVVLVRGLGPHDYGIYTLLLSVMSFLGLFYGLGAEATVTRFCAELSVAESNAVKKVFTFLFSLRVVSGSIACVFLYFFAPSIASFYSEPRLEPLIKGFSIVVLFWTATSIPISLLEGMYEQPFVNKVNIVLPIVNIGSLLLFLSLGFGLGGAVIASLVSAALGAIIYLCKVRRYLVPRVGLDTIFVKRIARYQAIRAIDPVVSYVSLAPLTSLFLGYFRPVEEVGYFNLAQSLSSYILGFTLSIVGSVGVVTLARAYATNPNSLRFASTAFLKLIYFFSIPLTIACFLVSDDLVGVFYGSQMLPAVPLLRALLVPVCLNLGTFVVCDSLLVMDKMRPFLILSALLSALFVACNLLFVPFQGASGAVLAVTVVYVLGAFVFSLALRRLMGGFVPLHGIVKYIAAGLLMSVGLVGFKMVIPAPDLPGLVFFALFGFSIYVLGVRLFNALDSQDKSLLIRSNLPFKQLLLKVLFSS